MTKEKYNDYEDYSIEYGDSFEPETFQPSVEEQEELVERRYRAKYSAKVDRFLNHGIIIVGVLLLAVLLIVFLV
ncbi:hypothetical protein [Dolosicoccus paucivorans]|uniref:Uncharacterized protein n=1 Tax=Dolosicoccus paucivorans TaxID=84521 RepID=A0A1G8L988_9LACT|nr:hypothetical protein [Dolosicoccus paucivorans]PMB84898.1 hypothetical protein CJ206_01725 [Dolosicoccus paucivorans]PMC58894.1 hypothetical protein CJ205_02265 [Dolosicoccus paucivorans]SDI52238.1 hypothetical protein SAMN04487994_101824 [Dolosicoccus paucivorans]